METVWDSSTIIFFGMDEGKSEYSYLTLHPTVAKVYEEFMSSLDSKALNLNAGGEEEKKEKKKKQ